MAKVRALRNNIEHGVLVDGKNSRATYNKGDVFEVTDTEALQLAEEGIVQLPKNFKVPDGHEIPEQDAPVDTDSADAPVDGQAPSEG
jgi:hypothetical protein